MKKLLALFMSGLFMLTFLPNSTVSVAAVEIPRNVSSEKSNLSSVPDSLNGTKITMLIWWNSGTDDQLIADTFQNETGIKVAYETAARDKYQTKLTSKVMANNSPELAAIINEWYPQPIIRGLFQPLSNINGWDFTDESKYALSLMKQFAYRDEMYGIALKGSSMNTFEVMFFNKDIMKAQGVTKDPYQLWKEGNWNWDTCLQIAQKCTNNQIGLKGITCSSMFYWMLSAGQDFVIRDPKSGLCNNIRNDDLLNTWYWNWDLINTYKVVDTTYTAAAPFFQGKAAMFSGGSYMMQTEASYYVPQNMKDDWGVVPFPSPKGMSVAACEGTVWGFPTRVTGNKLQAGAHYIHYYLDDKNYAEDIKDIYPTDHPECREVIDWMWEQPIQSYNSVGVLCYGGEYTAWSIQYSLVDEADTKAKVRSNLLTWEKVLDANLSGINDDHTCQYDANCDTKCDICGKVRSASAHTYTADCDTECDYCGEVRTALAHTYNADCDPKCNVCGMIRESLTHTYDNGCDESCNICGMIRESLTHTYDNACDAFCNICDAVREVGSHFYRDVCDTHCAICGAEINAPHSYSDNCDIDCNLCGAVREISHIYDNACDAYCNICNTYRVMTAHMYTNNCDRDCNVCGATRKAPHTFDNACDADCNNCGTERLAGNHKYNNSCDNSCNICGDIRTDTHAYIDATCAHAKICAICGITSGKALEHDYTAATCTKAKTCKECGAISGKKLGHTYSNACDKSCNRCKATRTVAGHEYKKVITKATTTKDGKIKNVCAECGYTSSKVTTIYKASKISLSKTSYTYNGKAQKPSVVVKDSKSKTISSKYYTVTYASGRKNVGTYKVTIKFKGNYSGTKTLTFKIIPRAASISKLTAKSKAITVKLNRSLKQSTGYEVQYSTSKSFSSAKTKIVKSYKTSSLSLTGLKAKKTYYVRVRTYKTVNGKKVYSNWSTAKSVKTK